MQNQDEKPIVQIVSPNTPKGGFLKSICHIMMFIGSVLTFIRNFIANLVMLLIIALIFVGIGIFNNFEENTQTVMTNKSAIPTNIMQADTVYFPLNGYISEIPFSRSQIDVLYRQLNSSLKGETAHELLEIEKALTYASSDKNIKRIVIDLQNAYGLTLSNTERLGKIIDELKSNGKEVITTAFNYSQVNYALASHASIISLDPLGEISLRGLSMQNLYFKDLLESMEITPYVFRAGHYKSAVEPYMRDNMSDDVKAQYQDIANNLWSIYTQEIGVRKAISRMNVLPAANDYAAMLEVYHGDKALMQFEQNLADKLISSSDLYKELAKADNNDPFVSFDKQPNVINYQDYTMVKDMQQSNLTDNNIYVVYGIGTIVDKAESNETFSPDNIIPILDKILQDKKAKAVVLYINSPGGTVTAATAITRKLNELKDHGIKIVVSMNGTAASGAYMIATAADKIIATESTITGSIGVFGVSFGVHDLLNDFGVYQDGVVTNDLAITPIASKLPQSQAKIINLQIQNTYRHFINMVANSRNLDENDYLKYAEGQIFLAKQAQDLKLVDEIGTFNDALNITLADLKLSLNNTKIIHTTAGDTTNLSVFEQLFFSKISSYLPNELSLALLEVKHYNQLKSDKNANQQILAICPIKAVQ